MIQYRKSSILGIVTPADMLQKAMTEMGVDFELYCEDSFKEGKPHWAFDNYRTGGTMGLGASHLFYTQPGWGSYFEQKFGRDKIKCVTYAVDKDIYPKVRAKKIYDVGFIGNVNDNDGRQVYLKAIEEKFNCFISREVPTASITAELAKCEVVFNQIRYEEINIRFFECLAAGAQVVSYSPTLHYFAEEGKHYLTYKTPEEAIAKIQYLLDNPDVAKKMASEARKHVLKHHTYKHRVKEMMDFL